MSKRLRVSIPVGIYGDEGMAAELERYLYQSILKDLKLSRGIDDPQWKLGLRKKVGTLRHLRATISATVRRSTGYQPRFLPIVPISSSTFSRFVQGETRVTFLK